MRAPSNRPEMAANGPRKAERAAKRAGVRVQRAEDTENEGLGVSGGGSAVGNCRSLQAKNPWGDSIDHEEANFEQWIQAETSLSYWEWSDRDERERERVRKEHDRKPREYASWCWNATH